MKLNWGTGIAIFIGLFIIAMLGMVFKASQQTHELVTTDYYAKELEFQDLLERKKHTETTFNTPVSLRIVDEEFQLIFPEELKEQPIAGTAYFFKASNEKLDKTVLINTTNAKYIFDVKIFAKGKYQLKIEWNVAKEEFYSELEVVFP